MKLSILLLVLSVIFASCAFCRDFSVLDYGAVGDGKTDCTDAFNKAVEAVRQIGGGNIIVPTGDYVIKGNITLYSGVGLIGTYNAIPTDAHPSSLPEKQAYGSVLLAYAGRNKPEDPAFITMKGNNVTLKGIIVKYPEWDPADIPPVPYPPCVAGTEGNDHNVIDCLFLNPYEALHFDGVGRVYVSNVSGYPQKRGLFIDRCYDVSRVENIHFWPFGIVYRPNEEYCAWIRENGVAFEFAKTDWQSCLNTFCYGYGVGYKFSNYGSGGGCGNYIGVGADACNTCFLVEATRPAGLQITNAQIVPYGAPDCHAVLIEKGVSDKVTLVNCGFWGSVDKAVEMRAPGGVVSVSDSHFAVWDTKNLGSPCIEVTEGIALIRGNTFRTSKDMPVVFIGPNARNAVVAENVSLKRFRVDNRIGSSAVVKDNLPSPELPEPPGNARNFKLEIGDPKAELYFEGLYGPENMSRRFEKEATASWLAGQANLTVPLKPNTKYTVTLEFYVPDAGADVDNGLYYLDKKILALDKTGPGTLTGSFKTGSAAPAVFDFRIRNWVPAETDPASTDRRTLSGAIKSITFTADNKAPVYDLGKERYLPDDSFPEKLAPGK